MKEGSVQSGFMYAPIQYTAQLYCRVRKAAAVVIISAEIVIWVFDACRWNAVVQSARMSRWLPVITLLAAIELPRVAMMSRALLRLDRMLLPVSCITCAFVGLVCLIVVILEYQYQIEFGLYTGETVGLVIHSALCGWDAGLSLTTVLRMKGYGPMNYILYWTILPVPPSRHVLVFPNPV